MSIVRRFAREPVAIAGVVSAIYGALIVFDVINPTTEQTGALAILGGAIITAIRWLVTPANEVVAQQTYDSDGPNVIVAGPAAAAPTGTAVEVRAI